ncbi:MAG TPA: gamma-glutamyltransferase, partial [Thermomicrobiaceae bacterium]|nr:gamma-glutamyltransferase [Thermomicrobiaceae bacterium]
SIGSPFGSAFMAGETGIMLNNFVNWTDLDRASPNAMQPGKKMENCMSPAQIYRDGRFYATIGTPGSWGILQTTPQMILNLLVFGMNIQEAIEAPRYRFMGGRTIALEARVPEDVRAQLEAMGHEIQLLPELSWAVGGGQGTLRDPDSGVLMGGADPRRDGYVTAW